MIPRSQLRDRITITPYLGQGALGPSYDTAQKRTDVPARVTLQLLTLGGAPGPVTISRMEALLLPADPITAPDKITYLGDTYEVRSVKPIDGDHLEVIADQVKE